MGASSNELTIRMLSPGEWHRLRDVVPYERIPDPRVATCCVVEQDGAIVGYLFAQLVIHAEPVWVKREHRGKDLPGQMWEMLKGQLPKGAPVYAFSKTQLVDHILGERCGFSRLPWSIFTTEVN